MSRLFTLVLCVFVCCIIVIDVVVAVVEIVAIVATIAIISDINVAIVDFDYVNYVVDDNVGVDVVVVNFVN